MKPLPNGGVELTPAEAFAVKQMVQAAGEDAYNLLGVQDAMPAGLDLAAQFERIDETAATLEVIEAYGAPLALSPQRSSLAIVGTALQAIAA